MKKYIILGILCCFLFVMAFYLPEFRWLFRYGYVDQKSVMRSCSFDYALCFSFKVIIGGDPPYRSGYLFIKNNKTGKFAEINNFFIDNNYQDLKPTQLVWTHNNQLDVYLKGKKGKESSNFFFKNLGNLTVIFHKN